MYTPREHYQSQSLHTFALSMLFTTLLSSRSGKWEKNMFEIFSIPTSLIRTPIAFSAWDSHLMGDISPQACLTGKSESGISEMVPHECSTIPTPAFGLRVLAQMEDRSQLEIALVMCSYGKCVPDILWPRGRGIPTSWPGLLLCRMAKGWLVAAGIIPWDIGILDQHYLRCQTKRDMMQLVMRKRRKVWLSLGIQWVPSLLQISFVNTLISPRRIEYTQFPSHRMVNGLHPVLVTLLDASGIFALGHCSALCNWILGYQFILVLKGVI